MPGVKKVGPKRDETIREIRDRLFIHYVTLELGIVPLENIEHDVRVALDALDPKEARAMKRKFRKLWRRYAREETSRVRGSYAQTYAKRTLGQGVRQPSRAQKKARKDLVRRRLWEQYIQPAITRFEAIEREKRHQDGDGPMEK